MKLDKTDMKLLTCLYNRYREPLTKISKDCRISRYQTEYRLEKYENGGLIKKYLTVFNYNLLGYNEFVICWLKLAALEEKEAIKKDLERMKNVISVGDVIAGYDLFVNFVFRDKIEFEKTFFSFIEKYKSAIIGHTMFITTYAEFFPLKAFGDTKEEKEYIIVKSIEPVQINEKDMAVLKLLEKNGRIKIIDLAKETGISSELLVYKIKQFYKNNIILGTRIQFDMEKLGFHFGLLKIKLKSRTEAIQKEIRNFCKTHIHINAITFGISKYDCLIQIFYKEEKEFRQTLKDINYAFKKEVENSQIILIENEGRVKTLPY